MCFTMNLNNIFRIIIIFFLLSANIAYAKKGRKFAANNKTHKNEASIVVDADTGKILHKNQAHKQVYPASLTKVMTAYLAFDAIEKGKIKLGDKFTVSKHAQSMRPLKLGLRYGEKISMETLINAINIRSANDAAVVIAEAISGTEDKFAILMSDTAKKLGMKSTIFKNASGWHHPKQITTAADMAKLTLAMKRDFPQYMHWFSKDSFTYKGRTIRGHNKVTRTYAGAEGMKTGYTSKAGYNLITSAVQEGKNLVGVVTGGFTSAKRDKKMTYLLDTYFKKHKLQTNVFAAAEFKTDNVKVARPAKVTVPKIKSIAKSKLLSKRKYNTLRGTNKSKVFADNDAFNVTADTKS